MKFSNSNKFKQKLADATLWQDYLGGIIQFNCGREANHAVQIVGYNLGEFDASSIEASLSDFPFIQCAFHTNEPFLFNIPFPIFHLIHFLSCLFFILFSHPFSPGFIHRIPSPETETPYYIVRNTWSSSFGLNGYLHVAIGGNLCALEERVSALDVEMIWIDCGGGLELQMESFKLQSCSTVLFHFFYFTFSPDFFISFIFHLKWIWSWFDVVRLWVAQTELDRFGWSHAGYDW